MTLTPFQYLPTFCKIALEYFGCQNEADRTIAKLDAYLEHYGKTYGVYAIEDHMRASCHHYATCRYQLTGDALIGLCTA